MVKLTDVAHHAGVSAGTVSRVLSGEPSVSPALVEAVQKAIADLGYRPNKLARGLRRQRTQTLGFVVPDITNPFFAELALSVEVAAADRGYNLFLGNSRNSTETEWEYLQNLLDHQVDGLIVVPAEETRGLPLALHTTPVVVLDREIQDSHVDFVGVDHHDGAREAVRYLAGLGHRVIACIAAPEGLGVGDQRYAGYAEVAAPLIEEAGLSPEDYVARGDFSFEAGVEAARSLLDQNPPPTAIFASNDQQAIGAIRHCESAGLTVPGDVSVVGFDDIPLATRITPTLTTVRQPIDLIGARAVEYVLDHDTPERGPFTARLRTHLEIRKSCAPPNR
jgi:LacI family transcriptional regulator